jgi:NDP-sugar pyrophosphorylase family protein
VTRFQEKPPPAAVFTDQANAGVYMLEPEVLDLIPDGTAYDFGKDVFPALLAAHPGRVFATPLGGYLQDTGTISAYQRANWDVLEGYAGPAEPGIHPTARVARSAALHARTVIGPETVIEDNARLAETITWAGCRIGARATVTGSILGRGACIGAGAVVTSAILADGATVAPGVRLPEGTRLAPGETAQ